MSRFEVVKELESERGSTVISYFTSDRQPFNTKIASDVVPLFGNLLEEIGQVPKISLVLYTSGGDMLAPIRIVKLLRSHCDEFEIIIPYRAHSAGTLISLGADKIVMGKLGELSPVDPTTGHPFNPQNPSNPSQKLEISVEDLNSYFLFAKEKAGVKEGQMGEVYKLLVEKLHPLSIGNAYRAQRMTKMLTERLLWLHMDKKKDAKKVEKIVKEITGDITIHAYPIDADEAGELGLKVEKADADLNVLLKRLYDSYAEAMNYGKPFNPAQLVAGKEAVEIDEIGALLETKDTTYSFTFIGQANRVFRNNAPAVDINFTSQTWVKK